VLTLVVYFVAMLALARWASARRIDAEQFIVANHWVTFGWASASMAAGWIWA